MLLETFSARLNELMYEENTSARKLAKAINVERKSIFLWLNGTYYPKYDALIKLAGFFEVNINYLLGLTDKVVYDKSHRHNVIDKKRVCDVISKYMAKNNLTAYAMSKRLNIGQTVFKRWTNDGAMPETANLIKLSVLTGESIDYILGLEE